MVFWSHRVYFSSRVYHPKFIDKLRIHVRGGVGGNGIPSLGGCGGHGGDVYIVASKNPSLNLKTFKDLHPTKRFAADAGQSSRRLSLNGLKGASIYIQVPRGVTVTDADRRLHLGEITNPLDKILVARGGRGGDRRTKFLPKKGERRNLCLDLKIIADVGFVGFPNAGKSTLLRTLSRAKPEVSAFPFTTIKPEVGIMAFDDFRKIQLADLPGLIEGAYMNKGRGHSFLKHIERTNLFMFVVDIGGFQLSPSSEFRSAFETVQLLVKELELYDESLTDKPSVLVVNKMDVEGSNVLLEELKHQMDNYEDYVVQLPKKSIPNYPMHFLDVIPVSAMSGSGISGLRLKIRQRLDGRKLLHDQDLLQHPGDELPALSETADNLSKRSGPIERTVYQ